MSHKTLGNPERQKNPKISCTGPRPKHFPRDSPGQARHLKIKQKISLDLFFNLVKVAFFACHENKKEEKKCHMPSG